MTKTLIPIFLSTYLLKVNVEMMENKPNILFAFLSYLYLYVFSLKLLIC